MNKQKNIKKVLIFGILVLSIYGVINLIWLIGVKMEYDAYSKNMKKVVSQEEEDVARISYYKTKNGYTYSIKSPSYLSNNGFVTVAKEEGYVAEIDEEGNLIADNGVCVTLFIWPTLFAETQYGIDIWSEKEGISYQLYIDKNGNYIPEDASNIELNEYYESIMKEYETEIQKLLKLVEKQWDL